MSFHSMHRHYTVLYTKESLYTIENPWTSESLHKYYTLFSFPFAKLQVVLTVHLNKYLKREFLTQICQQQFVCFFFFYCNK